MQIAVALAVARRARRGSRSPARSRRARCARSSRAAPRARAARARGRLARSSSRFAQRRREPLAAAWRWRERAAARRESARAARRTRTQRLGRERAGREQAGRASRRSGNSRIFTAYSIAGSMPTRGASCVAADRHDRKIELRRKAPIESELLVAEAMPALERAEVDERQLDGLLDLVRVARRSGTPTRCASLRGGRTRRRGRNSAQAAASAEMSEGLRVRRVGSRRLRGIARSPRLSAEQLEQLLGLRAHQRARRRGSRRSGAAAAPCSKSAD